ncbi:Retrovirus-related Pol polyprotein from transposon TNT 1-94 [Vitis vinifera]|uniref:Retrovirus-related Pol polyprotein from transposon TNT 1-94 n=1 Tax=Vitis vinifera TaxID=29760 RepID=A0A438IDV1_VITVI|nr:Retrovirus-related Pol polyprotein from transposon TNT 1-94 [Vitis vinifera]
MIMSWLINSMNNDIGENFLLFGTAKDIWDAAKETYSSSENTSELFQVESALHDFRQGEQSVTQYYNTLIRGRIMGIKPLPSLREAFSEVRREESRKKVMMGSKEQPTPTLDGSALAARSFNSSGGDRQKRDRPWCDYYKKPGHYKEACWKLHGKPADWKPKPRGSTTGIALTASRGGMKSWIVDTGASDHMTGDAAILQNYKPSNGHSSVHIVMVQSQKLSGQDLKSGKMIGSVNCVPGSTSSHVANSQTKSLKQVAYSLRSLRIKIFLALRWFVTFVDDHTRVTWVFLMKEKSEVGHIFQTFNLMVQNQFNSKIQVLKSDNAKEYFTSSLSTYLQNHGIIHISSCVDTPQQNGVAERKNRHLLEVARCLMFSSNVPNYFWGKLFSQLPI